MTVSLPKRVTRGLQPFFGFDPFRVLQEEMNSLFNRNLADWNGDWLTHVSAAPSLDLSETAESLQIRTDMPGISAEDIDIEISDDILRVTGEHKEEKEEKGKTYHRIERRLGTFCRTVTLPCPVKQDKVTAEFKDGVLN
ncbi:MAG: Hsp20/alpha crystallin family protein, partial [Planctomycetes bacterium]|nr:Hsp20/alpha crystallin family protein [Planctomycetota bacterium]